ncbi:MAG: ATP-binding protein, partial [Defluviitaleaceae bacterium]|nr:ATP-binding protein [Defluviitaleaceae bacterium]
DEVYCDTGNIAFDSIINFKLKNAKEKNVKPKLQMSIPRTLNIEVADIVTILGNLLDNALDAVEKSTDKILRIDIEYNRGCLFIKADNSFDGEVKYETKKDSGEKSIVTHKEPSEHGHGLKNIRKAVDKYNGKVDIVHEGNVFSVTILIYVDNDERLAK